MLVLRGRVDNEALMCGTNIAARLNWQIHRLSSKSESDDSTATLCLSASNAMDKR